MKNLPKDLDPKKQRGLSSKLTRSSVTTDVSKVLSDFKTSILTNHNAITQSLGNVVLLHIQTGNWLRAAKNLVPHGQFESWFSNQFGNSLTLRTAQRYMRVSRIAESKIDSIKEKAAMLDSTLEVSDLELGELVKRLPASDLIELISYRDETTKRIDPPRTQIFDPSFAKAMLEFLDGPMLILSSFELDQEGLEAPEIVVCKDPIGERSSWPSTALVLIDSEASAKSLHRLLQSRETGEMKECLVLLPACLASHVSLHDCPQLNFTRIQPLTRKVARSAAMTLLLLSESVRVPDFASFFHAFGLVKVPYIRGS